MQNKSGSRLSGRAVILSYAFYLVVAFVYESELPPEGGASFLFLAALFFGLLPALIIFPLTLYVFDKKLTGFGWWQSQAIVLVSYVVLGALVAFLTAEQGSEALPILWAAAGLLEAGWIVFYWATSWSQR